MFRAKCPFCGEKNIVGLFVEKRPNERTATMQPCPHVVFVSITAYPAAEYVHRELYIELGKRPGSYGLEAELMRILNTHFRFVGQ